MYGLKKEPDAPFLFDLEADLKGDTDKVNKMQEEVRARIAKLKSILREGASSDAEFGALEKLLKGYDAMLVVLNRIKSNKEAK